VRLDHPVDADRVEVSAEQQRAPAAGASRAHHDARPAGNLLEHPRLEPRVACPLRDERGDRTLTGGAWHQSGIDRVDRDERGGELDDVLAHPARDPA
jgi:hypothetical protein